MKKFLLLFAITVGISNSWLLGCSKSDDVKSENTPKTMREETTNKQAEEIRKTLRTPIDKAKAAHDMGDERTRAIDEAVKNK